METLKEVTADDIEKMQIAMTYATYKRKRYIAFTCL